MRVLIAGGDAAASRQLAELLRQWGYDPVTAQDGGSVLTVSLSAGQRMPALPEQHPAAQLPHQAPALPDLLTGLRTRATILEDLDRELARAPRQGHLVSIIMAGVDRFQCLKESCARRAVDEVVRQTAQQLLKALQPIDNVGRCGNEFLIVLSDCSAGQALLLAEQLRQLVATAPVMLNDEAVRVTMSLGVAGWDGKQRASDLLRTAHGALSEAKRGGGNLAVYSEGLPVNCWLSETTNHELGELGERASHF